MGSPFQDSCCLTETRCISIFLHCINYQPLRRPCSYMPSLGCEVSSCVLFLNRDKHKETPTGATKVPCTYVCDRHPFLLPPKKINLSPLSARQRLLPASLQTDQNGTVFVRRRRVPRSREPWLDVQLNAAMIEAGGSLPGTPSGRQRFRVVPQWEVGGGKDGDVEGRTPKWVDEWMACVRSG